MLYRQYMLIDNGYVLAVGAIKGEQSMTLLELCNRFNIHCDKKNVKIYMSEVKQTDETMEQIQMRMQRKCNEVTARHRMTR